MIAADYGESACGGTFSYFLPPPNSSGKSFVFKNNVAKKGLLKDNPSGLGAGGPRFKSGRPDQNTSGLFFGLSKDLFTPNWSVEFPETGGLNSQVVYSPIVPGVWKMQKDAEAGVPFGTR
jgi:hypothetical protein